MTKREFVAVLLMVILHSCTNRETTNEPVAGQEAIYREYSIWSEEGNEWATGLFQFFANRKERRSMELREPAHVAFDKNILVPDSAEVTGVFYEIQIPFDEFPGRHTIAYTDANKKEYEDHFEFTPFRVVNDLSEQVSRSNLVLKLEGLEEDDLVRVVATDTSLMGNGINEMDTVRNNQLDLRQRFEEEIVNGPVMLQLFKEEERPLESKPGGGKIAITYSIKREFELVD